MHTEIDSKIALRKSIKELAKSKNLSNEFITQLIGSKGYSNSKECSIEVLNEIINDLQNIEVEND